MRSGRSYTSGSDPVGRLLLRQAGLVEPHTIFAGAAVCCVVAGHVALVVFRRAETRVVETQAFGVCAA